MSFLAFFLVVCADAVVVFNIAQSCSCYATIARMFWSLSPGVALSGCALFCCFVVLSSRILVVLLLVACFAEDVTFFLVLPLLTFLDPLTVRSSVDEVIGLLSGPPAADGSYDSGSGRPQQHDPAQFDSWRNSLTKVVF